MNKDKDKDNNSNIPEIAFADGLAAVSENGEFTELGRSNIEILVRRGIIYYCLECNVFHITTKHEERGLRAIYEKGEQL